MKYSLIPVSGRLGSKHLFFVPCLTALAAVGLAETAAGLRDFADQL